MIKNWKLAFGLALGLWAIIFIVISAIIVMPISSGLMTTLTTLVSPVAAFILARIYFKKYPGAIIAGVLLAVFWLIVGTVLDLLVTIQYVKGFGSYVDGLKDFYGAWTLWLSFGLMIAAVALAAKLTHGGKLMPMSPGSNQSSSSQPKPPTA